MRIKITLPYAVYLIAAIGISNKSIAGVDGFVVCSRTQRYAPPSLPLPARNLWPSPSMISSSQLKHQSVRDSNLNHSQNSAQANWIRKFRWILKRRTTQCTTKLMNLWLNSRQLVLTFCAVVLFWFGAAGTHTPISHGSSISETNKVVSRSSILSSSFDQIVDKYVKGHMFEDDVYDPVESIYREAMDDKIKGSYPRDLQESTSSVLGQDVVKADKKASSGTGLFMKSIEFLRKKGLSEMQSIAVMTGAIIIGFPTLGLFTFMSFTNKGKESVDNLMEKRYGTTYTVDASENGDDDNDNKNDNKDDDDDDNEEGGEDKEDE